MRTEAEQRGVAYLTTLSVCGDEKIALWRAVAGAGRLWFERFGPDGWREDADLAEAVEAAGTVRLTPAEARWVAVEHFGCAW
jgi:hypothetical protein